MDKETGGELAFLDTSLKRNVGEISVLVYRKPTHTGQYLHYSSHHQIHTIITNNDDLHKEKTRMKQVLKEKGYQESIISKIFKRNTNNHNWAQSQQLTQTTK